MFKKSIYLIILAALLCLSLTSCGYKDTHMHRIDEDTLTFKGTTYSKLTDEDPSFSILKSRSTTVYVTDRTVPALLSRIFHEDWYGSTTTYMSENEYFISDGTEIFCREDIYPEITEISDNEYDSYCYEYYIGLNKACYILTEDEMAAVDTVLSKVEPIASYDLGYLPEIKDIIYLEYLKTDTEIARGKDSLYVLEDGYCFKEILEHGITAYIIVPDELEVHFDSMTKAYYGE